MFLEKLYTENFRNIQTHEIQFSKGINLISGDNGQGKTNLLEAIYFLSNLKSFRKSKRKDLRTWETNRFGVKGSVVHEKTGEKSILEAVCDQGKSQYRTNNHRVEVIEDYLSHLPVMAFHPDSLSVLKGGPALRRMFIDRGIFGEDRNHLSILKGYNRVLAERRWILKNRRRELIDVWNEKLVDLGVKLTAARGKYSRRLNNETRKVELPPGETAHAEIRYCPSIMAFPEKGAFEEELRTVFFSRIKNLLEEEEKRGISMVGPHRDEFLIYSGGRDLSTYGSQGQQKGALLCIILGQSNLAAQGKSGDPLMIFDDVMSELDGSRVEWIRGVLETMGNQIFISALEKISLRNRLGVGKKFIVRQGKIEPVGVAA
jgi:DNA replication and repair protein RecF